MSTSPEDAKDIQADVRWLSAQYERLQQYKQPQVGEEPGSADIPGLLTTEAEKTEAKTEQDIAGNGGALVSCIFLVR